MARDDPRIGGGEGPEKLTTIAEELELPNGLLKITRDDGLPVGFVRARASDGWTRIDWRKLEVLNVEDQGLERDKLSEEMKRIRAARVKVENRLPASAKHPLDQESGRADVPNWCRKCRVSLETRGDLETNKAQCGVGLLEYVVGTPEVR